MSALPEEAAPRPNDCLLGTVDAAVYLGLHPVTLRKYRQANRGPEWTVLPGSRQVRYELCKLREWAGVVKGGGA
jgi:hypothetical protein